MTAAALALAADYRAGKLRGLPARALAVYAVYAAAAMNGDRFTKASSLAAAAGVSSRTLTRAMGELRRAGVDLSLAPIIR